MPVSHPAVARPSSRRCRTDSGATLVEYLLLVTLIAVACLLAIGLLGRQVGDRYDGITSEIQAGTPG